MDTELDSNEEILRSNKKCQKQAISTQINLKIPFILPISSIRTTLCYRGFFIFLCRAAIVW